MKGHCNGQKRALTPSCPRPYRQGPAPPGPGRIPVNAERPGPPPPATTLDVRSPARSTPAPGPRIDGSPAAAPRHAVSGAVPGGLRRHAHDLLPGRRPADAAAKAVDAESARTAGRRFTGRPSTPQRRRKRANNRKGGPISRASSGHAADAVPEGRHRPEAGRRRMTRPDAHRPQPPPNASAGRRAGIGRCVRTPAGRAPRPGTTVPHPPSGHRRAMRAPPGAHPEAHRRLPGYTPPMPRNRTRSNKRIV